VGWHRSGVFDDRDACGVGFIAQLGSAGSHQVVERALTALVRLSHRGGVDADGRSGDGAGLLTTIPDNFIRQAARQAGIELPESFGLGMVFLTPEHQAASRAAIEAAAARTGLRCLGWRIVPTNSAILGPRALDTLPAIQQCFLAAPSTGKNDVERLLFLFRKRMEAEVSPRVYFCSLSSRTVVYKGLLAPAQLPAFYPDLQRPDFESPFAVFHQRYSTNTRPTWRLAQPFRFVAHNGEINTIGANRRWLGARAADIRRRLAVGEWFPIMEEEVSDSASFDNAFEILLRQGYSPPAAMLRMVPPAWEADHRLPPELRRYLEGQTREQEPWDGPAALVFSDGRVVGAKLDRNGLRPLRYTLTADGLLVAGSEVGLADLEGKHVSERQRLGPGEMLLVDTVSGGIFRNHQISALLHSNGGSSGISRRLPSASVMDAPAEVEESGSQPSSAPKGANLFPTFTQGCRPGLSYFAPTGLESRGSVPLPIGNSSCDTDSESPRGFAASNAGGPLKGSPWLKPRPTEPRFAAAKPTSPTAKPTCPTEATRTAAALGWTEDQFRLLFQPLVTEGKEATWSMGDDAPPAFLSAARRSLWDYCKQRFAQVTNPPIDPLREKHVMSLELCLGGCVTISSPVLDREQMAALLGADGQFSKSLKPVRRIDLTLAAAEGVPGALAALQQVRREACPQAEWPGMVVLSDRAVSAGRAALPALLGVAAAWKSMVEGNASDVPLVIETGQVIDTHHVALLIAAGASAVFPYLALEFAESLKPGGSSLYRAAVDAGLRKVLARMGISTLASYRNSQLFEIVGLDADVCAEFFEDAASVLGGKGLAELMEDILERHASAFHPNANDLHPNAPTEGAPGIPVLRDAGLYRFRKGGERHSSSPELVRRLHQYIQSPTAENYSAYAELALSREPVAVRDLLEIDPAGAGPPLPLEEVELESAILSRFSTQAMSLGAISPEAHRALAIAMNRLGARSNTGEGGEDPEIYRANPEAGNRVKQVASARFGVTAEYLARADELEIKIAQGSKPGEGGQLPGAKVSAYIARLRHAVPGMALISPPPHHDIYSIEDLAQLIYDLRAINPLARIGVKLVAGAGVGIIAAGVAKAGANVITICGFDGGTGASPLTSIKNTGIPWEAGLREAHLALLQAGFRERVRLRVDGGFKLGRDVIIAALLGADEFGFGTAALLAIGCVMARQCHLNTCPVGLATQDEKLRARFAGKPEMVISYFRAVAGEVRQRLAALGARSLHEIIGATERLRPRDSEAARALGQWLQPPPERASSLSSRKGGSRFLPFTSGDDRITAVSPAATADGIAIRQFGSSAIRQLHNSDRSVGAHLSGEILRGTGFSGLHTSSGKMEVEFRGVAGQSFGAFLIPGVNFRLHGEANDYVGKGLSGGRIAITAGREASLRGDVLVGNTVLYGATSGELYVAGRAGERFAVRNSGALAVVEGVGQHACEYMTAGVVIVLGPVSLNLGSGMTGGLAYIPRDGHHWQDSNPEFVRTVPVDEEERWLRRVLREHFRLTDSPRAAAWLNSPAPLPLLRLEPLQLPCPAAQTWAAVLKTFDRSEMPSLPLANVALPQGPPPIVEL